MRRCLLLPLLLLGLSPAAAGGRGPGSADPRFENRDEHLFTSLRAPEPPRRGWPAGRPAALLADGGFAAAGLTYSDDERTLAVVRRYRADGSDDPAFGTAGEVVLRELPDTRELPPYVLQALTALPDGGVAGAGRDAGGVLVAFRLDRAGAVVWSTRTVPPGARWRQTGAVAVDAAGGLLVAGAADAGMALVRLDLTTGALDPAFGARVEPIGRRCPAMATGVVALAGGGVAVGGTAARCARTTPYGALVLYGADGSRTVRRGAALGLRNVAGLTAAPGGGLVATGPVRGSRLRPPPPTLLGERYAAEGVAGIARFDAAGTLTATKELGPGNATGVAVDADGRVLATVNRGSGVITHRILPDGRADRTWDVSGQPLQGLDLATTVIPLPDGGVIAVGSGDASLDLAALRGGTALGRLTVGAAGIGRRGMFRLDVRCAGAPGCEGSVLLRDVHGRVVSRDIDGFRGPETFQLRGGGTGVVRLGLDGHPRVVDATITNPPERPVRRRIRLPPG